MSKPHRCPICLGRGIVTSDFYSLSYTTKAAPQMCRTCKGKGIIWALEDGEIITEVLDEGDYKGWRNPS